MTMDRATLILRDAQVLRVVLSVAAADKSESLDPQSEQRYHKFEFADFE